MNEAELVRLLCRGDNVARQRLFESEAERVWSVACRLTGDYDLAQDVTQETFLRAFRKVSQFRGTGPIGAWLMRIAVNIARDKMKAERRREGRHVSLQSAYEMLPAAAPVAADAHEMDEELHVAVNELEEGHRTVLLLHDVEGFTHEEIGAALGIATGSSRARLSRARAQLRAALAAKRDT